MPRLGAQRPPAHPVLRVLVVEDNPLDAELVVAILKRAGFPVSFEVVDAPAAFERALAQWSPDLVLCDHNLRTWTGFDALTTLKTSGKDVPLIVVTAALGDEAAVDYVKQGAADYVLKHRLERLPVVVRQALRDKAHREESARLQEQIVSAKREWELTFDGVSDPIMVVDAQSAILRANRATSEMAGKRFHEIIGRTCGEIARCRTGNGGRCPLEITLETGRPANRDLLQPDSERWFECSVSPLSELDGTLKGAIVVLHEFTERRKAEVATRELAAIVESSEDAIVGKTLEGIIQTWNRGAEKLYGYPAEEAVGQLVSMLVPAEAAEEIPRILESVRKGEAVRAYETLRRRKDGALVPVSVAVSPIFDSQGEVVGASTITRDITERKRAEQSLQESEERFRQLAENIEEVFYMEGPEGLPIEYISPAYEKVWGRTRASVYADPLSWQQGIHPEDWPRLREQFEALVQRGSAPDTEFRVVRPDGTVRWVWNRAFMVRNEAGEALRTVGFAADITERKHLEAQLRQAQKMEAIGRLAGGVAHDFNNLLTIISGYGQLVLEALPEEDPLRSQVAEVLKASERATSLTRQLLAFGRRQVLAPRVLDLNEAIADTEKMLRRLIGEDIELVAIPARDLGHVKADPGQIEQVILNLAVNARDAMPEGGRLTIETSSVMLDEAYADQHVSVQPGPYVMLAVSDTGHGMDSDTQAHLFEPFFTTKEKGKGTGLGLATVYGIVKQSGGYIWVYSEPGQGTTFKVYLPRIQEAVEATPPPPVERTATGGSETILLVEDDSSVRSLVHGVLASRGYKLLVARNAEEALILCEQHKGPIHLLLTDVVMPGISGRDLAERLNPFHREMTVLYMSGYTDNAIVHHGVLDANVRFLQKPFSPLTLANKVRAILDGAE